MHVAVIGSGISGLTAAYLLSPHAKVTLYEKEGRLGGHAHTAIVPVGGKTMPVDTGFMVFNPSRYPYFVSLLQTLGVETPDTNMSFSVSIPGTIEYSSSIGGILGDVRQLLRLAYVRFIVEIPRFNRVGTAFLSEKDDTLTIGDFLKKYAFSEELATWYVFPMIASIWSTDAARIPDFPARETLLFLDNHQLLSILGGPQWKTIGGGSICYVAKLTERLREDGVEIRTDQHIKRITRSPIQVHTDRVETFDAVILATHADEALSLITDAHADEIDILKSFSYARNTAVLHSDISFMPKRQSAWAAWNYHAIDTTAKKGVVSLTYNMNMLQNIPTSFPVFVTLNPQRPIAPGATFETFEYTHPMANSAARHAQKRLPTIQGKRGTYFVGAYWNNGFHEDGVVSAIEAVKALNFPIRITP